MDNTEKQGLPGLTREEKVNTLMLIFRRTLDKNPFVKMMMTMVIVTDGRKGGLELFRDGLKELVDDFELNMMKPLLESEEKNPCDDPNFDLQKAGAPDKV